MGCYNYFHFHSGTHAACVIPDKYVFKFGLHVLYTYGMVGHMHEGCIVLLKRLLSEFL